MSTSSTFPTTSDRMNTGIDLALALVSLGQALRVAELAHAGASSSLENLPRDMSVEDVRERTGDSLVLFGQALRLIAERNETVLDLARKLIAME